MSTGGGPVRWGPRWRGSRAAGALLAVLAASLLCFSALAEEVAGGEPGVSFDGSVAVWLHTHAQGAATGVLSAVTQLGGALVLVPVTLVAALALLRRSRRAHALLMTAALVGGEGLNLVLKAAFERPRPRFSDPLATAAGFLVPERPREVSMAVYGALAFVAASTAASRRTRRVILGSAVALVLAIGFSRVYLGVHYVSDVLAAYSAGLAWLALCALAFLGVSRLANRVSPTVVGAPQATRSYAR